MTKSFFKLVAITCFAQIWLFNIAVHSSERYVPPINFDFDFDVAIPAIGRVTIRKNIRHLPNSRLFSNCPEGTRLNQFAESTTYLVTICSDEEDLNEDKYWIQLNKITGEIKNLIAFYPTYRELGPSWKDGDLGLYLYIDGRDPECDGINAYLARGGSWEALWYHYDRYYEMQDCQEKYRHRQIQQNN